MASMLCNILIMLLTYFWYQVPILHNLAVKWFIKKPWTIELLKLACISSSYMNIIFSHSRSHLLCLGVFVCAPCLWFCPVSMSGNCSDTENKFIPTSVTDYSCVASEQSRRRRECHFRFCFIMGEQRHIWHKSMHDSLSKLVTHT